MPINVQCENCDRRLRVGDNLAGKRIKCPQCQSVITVSVAAAEEILPKIETDKKKGAEKPAAPAPTISINTEKSKSPSVAAGKQKTPETPAKKESDFKPVVEKKVEKKPASPAPKEPDPVPEKTAGESYYVKTEEGEYYGPVPKEDLDEWVVEGRLGEECQLLLDGTDQWLWASDIFPELAKAHSDSQSSGFSLGDADDEADTVAFKMPEVSSKKKTPVREEDEPEHQEPEDEHEEDEEDEPAPVSKKKTLTKSSPKALNKSSSKKKAKAQFDEDEDQEESDRSLMTAGLLAIFMGITGAHRFYLGYVLHGVLMSVTCGGALIWLLIDIVQILRGKLPDVHGRPLKK